jgi:hypothetical protein
VSARTPVRSSRGGHALADTVEEDRAAVTVRLEPDVRPAPGSSVHLSVDPAGVHLFEAESGLAIR